MAENPYIPISCDFHDHLLAYATLRQICAITYTNAAGSQEETQDRIVDVYTQSGEEFLKLQSGIVIRLDRLIGVEPVYLGPQESVSSGLLATENKERTDLLS